MSIIAIINIVIVNIIAWAALSYFWSFWTHRLFKPWLWLEQRKRKMIAADVESRERKSRDRARFYSVFFAMEQVERGEVPGAFVMAGMEDADLACLLRRQCPEREVWALGPLEATTVSVAHENCQGETTSETVAVDFAPEAEVRRVLPTSPLNHVVKGAVADGIGQVTGPVALALVDCVDHDTVLASLRHLYPLLPPGGILIVHSYNHTWEGVRRATDEFVAGVPEGIVPLPDIYGSVALVRGKG